MYILYMFVLNNTPFVHARVYLQYLKSALPGIVMAEGTLLYHIMEECSKNTQLSHLNYFLAWRIVGGLWDHF